MCGIAVATCSSAADRDSMLRAMLTAVAHRGVAANRDEWLDVPCHEVVLGANRLPIVAPAYGGQPKHSPRGQYIVVFNGEIFNHRDLLTEIRAAGLAVPDHGDTTLLAAALEAWGPLRVADRCVWEGAFVCLDTRTGSIWAARDHLGIRPLYWAPVRGGTAWASEIKALVPHALGSIRPVAPGTVMRRPAGRWSKIATHTWWRPDDHLQDSGAESAEELADEAERLIREAVRVRVPDGPYAVALSGGVDSSLIVTLAREVNDRVTAYVLNRPGSPDLAYARQLCQLLDVRLVEVAAHTPAQLANRLSSVVWSVESWEWHVVNHAGPMPALFDAIRRDGHQVTLTGEGADELFLGYTPQGTRDALGRERLGRVRDLHRTNCRRLDRMGMAATVECRVPFLDRALTEFALGVDPGFMVRAGLNKWLLRQVALRVMPPKFSLRGKLSFARGAGFRYRPGSDASVYGNLATDVPWLPAPWAELARYPVERVFLRHFLDNGYGKADYLCSRST